MSLIISLSLFQKWINSTNFPERWYISYESVPLLSKRLKKDKIFNLLVCKTYMGQGGILAKRYSEAWSVAIPDSFRHLIRHCELNEFAPRIREAYLEAISISKRECCRLNDFTGNVSCQHNLEHSIEYSEILKKLICPSGIEYKPTAAEGKSRKNPNPVDYEWLRKNNMI